MANKKFRDILTDLGLTGGLQLCLDAGEAASYDPGVQTAKWLDPVSGYDFYRGTSAGGDAAEPTFNGVAGDLLPSTYWSSDGGDYFRYDSPNEAWMDAMHKDNALWTILDWYYPAGAGPNRFCGGSNNNNAQVGISHGVNTSTGVASTSISNGLGTYARVINTAGSYGAVDGAWQFFGLSVDEAADSAIWHRSGVSLAPQACSFTTPSAATATNVFEVGAHGNALSPMPNGARMRIKAIWNVAMTAAQMAAIHGASRHLFYPVGRGLTHGISLGRMEPTL